jgi:hypothetical protein
VNEAEVDAVEQQRFRGARGVCSIFPATSAAIAPAPASLINERRSRSNRAGEV